MNVVFLKPGDFHFGRGQVRIDTLLGSCVSVTLWHPRLRCGGMCHFMLPRRPRAIGAAPDGHYADEAFALFDRAIARCLPGPAEFEAKLFGGGNMFPGSGDGLAAGIGARNIDTARRLLAGRGIAVVAEHVGAFGHRKLSFDLPSGNVWLDFQAIRRADGDS